MRTRCMTGLPASRVLCALLTGVATAAFLLSATGVALAHDAVVATTPAADGSAASPPSAVELKVSAPPQVLGTAVRVTGPDGSVVSEGEPEALGSTVRQPLADSLPAGVYTVDWRVTSGDGHPITGSFTFTVATGASSPASAPAEAVPDAAADDGGDLATGGEVSDTRPVQSSSSAGLVLGGAVVVLVLAGLVAWRLRRSA